MRRTITAIMAAAILAMTSCTREEEPEEAPSAPAGRATVTFNVGAAAPARSGINPDEDILRDITVAAYRDGRLWGTATGDRPSMEVVLGCSYDLYALANCGRVPPPASEEEFRRHTVSVSPTGLQRGIPMVWSRTGWTPAPHSKEQRLDIVLERMASRISFKLDKGTLEGLTVSSVRLMDTPLSVKPFAEGGSRVTRASDTGDGDYAGASDLQRLNAGGAVTFYTPENCQGVLLPGNTDPWRKVPDSIREKQGLCTWIEVKGSFAPGSFLSGDVTWRIYPGRDNCTDFTLGRNTDIGITLYVTGPGLRQVSWKVDADVTVDRSSASAAIDGMHGADDLYTGERFDLVLDIREELTDYLGGRPEELSVAFIPDGKEGGVQFGRPVAEGSPGRFRCPASCTAPGTGEFWLEDRDGRPLVLLTSGVAVRPPVAVPSLSASAGAGTKVPAVSGSLPAATVNGRAQTVYIYFTDRAGYNLNVSAERYSLDPFTFRADVTDDRFTLAGTMDLEVRKGPAPGGPAAVLTYRCTNDGLDRQLNDRLCQGIGAMTPLELGVGDLSGASACTLPVDLSFLPVEITLVDNGWAGYWHPAVHELAVKVKNPSNITLLIDCWTVMQTRGERGVPPTDGTVSGIRSRLDIQEYAYLTETFNGEPPLTTWMDHGYPRDMRLYATRAPRIVVCRGAGGTERVTDGDFTVHPLAGVDTGDLLDAMRTGRSFPDLNTVHKSMYTLIDVSAPDMQLFGHMFTVKDMLSDGSTAYDVKYGEHYGSSPGDEAAGLNDRGVWVWADGMEKARPGVELDSYGLSVRKLDAVTDPAAYKVVYPTYTDAAGKLEVSYRGDPVTADVRVRVQCTSRAELGGKSDTWKETAESLLRGVTLGGGSTAIDDGCIRRAMEAACAHKVSNMWGKKAYAHPTSLAVTVQARRTGTGRGEPFMMGTDFSVNRQVHCRHPQEGKTYSITDLTFWAGNRRVFTVKRK